MSISTEDEVAKEVFQHSRTISFADVAHQTLLFDMREEADRLIMDLLASPWMQRLRNVSQTGNTKLVYMFAEHSRFGHSLGVAYLSLLLMRHLRIQSPELVLPYQNAVAAAALLHDVGHVAPGSHLAERVWTQGRSELHEQVSLRVIKNDTDISVILASYDSNLVNQIEAILTDDDSVPPWTRSVIHGAGWNVDRGNWSIVDSAMCSVSYGRYNVLALIDAFRLSKAGELVLQENRLDALTHFFVARDSMYRQVYQHRVLQAADALTKNIVIRLRRLLQTALEEGEAECGSRGILSKYGIFCDESMLKVLLSKDYAQDVSLEVIWHMTENWWSYHLEQWSCAQDPVLKDLSSRLRDRRLFKTVRMESSDTSSDLRSLELIEEATKICSSLGFDPDYYINVIEEKDRHRSKAEQPPMVALENGKIIEVTAVEPMIEQLMKRPSKKRTWLAMPKEVKEKLMANR